MFYIKFKNDDHGSGDVGIGFDSVQEARDHIDDMRKRPEYMGYAEWVGGENTSLWIEDESRDEEERNQSRWEVSSQGQQLHRHSRSLGDQQARGLSSWRPSTARRNVLSLSEPEDRTRGGLPLSPEVPRRGSYGEQPNSSIPLVD